MVSPSFIRSDPQADASRARTTIRSALAEQFDLHDHRSARWVVAVWATAVGVAFALLGPSQWRLGLIGEALTYLALGIALTRWRPLRRLGAGPLSDRRRLLALLLGLMLLGQLAGGSRLAFPLVRFSMYSDEVGATEVVHSFEAVGRDGGRTVVTETSLFPFWRSYRFHELVARISRDVGAHGGCGPLAALVQMVADLAEWRPSVQAGEIARFEVVATTYDLRRTDGGAPAVADRSVLCALAP